MFTALPNDYLLLWLIIGSVFFFLMAIIGAGTMYLLYTALRAVEDIRYLLIQMAETGKLRWMGR